MHNLENELEASNPVKQSESQENMRPIPAARKNLFDLNTESCKKSNNDIELQNIDSNKTYHTSPLGKIDIESNLNDDMSYQTPVTQQHKPAPPLKPKKISLTEDPSEQQTRTHEKPSIVQVPNDEQQQITHSELSLTQLAPYEQQTTSDDEPSLIRCPTYEKPPTSDDEPSLIRCPTYEKPPTSDDEPSLIRCPTYEKPPISDDEPSLIRCPTYEKPPTSDDEPSLIRHPTYEKPPMQNEEPPAIRRPTYIQAMYAQPNKEQEAIDKVQTPNKTSTNLTRPKLDTKPKPKKRLKTGPLYKEIVPENDEASKQNEPWYDHPNGSIKIKEPSNTDSILSTKGSVNYMETMPEIVSTNDFYCCLFFYSKIKLIFKK